MSELYIYQIARCNNKNYMILYSPHPPFEHYFQSFKRKRLDKNLEFVEPHRKKFNFICLNLLVSFLFVFDQIIFIKLGLLSAFGKLRKAIINLFVSASPSISISVCPFVRKKNSAPLRGFPLNLIFEYFSKIC